MITGDEHAINIFTQTSLWHMIKFSLKSERTFLKDELSVVFCRVSAGLEKSLKVLKSSELNLQKSGLCCRRLFDPFLWSFSQHHQNFNK